nr:hypothetical protein [uncultured Allomuricauda sp.]
MKNIVYFLFLMLLWACSSNSTDEDVIDIGDKVSFRFNSAERNSLDDTATGSLTETTFGDTTIFALGIAAGFSDLLGNVWGLAIIVTTTESLDSIEGKSWSSSNIYEYESFNAAYNEDFISEDLIEAESDENQSFLFTITELDTQNKTVSGNFSFEAIDTVSGETHQITDGKFNNINYTTN